MEQLLTPGIYPAIPADTYFALPYASNSRLSLLKRSPAHAYADMLAPREDTDALRLGRAIHTAALEPSLFHATYALAGGCAAELKSGARKGQPCGNGGRSRHDGAWFCGTHSPDGESDTVTALSVDDWDVCKGLRVSLSSHPKLGRLLNAEGAAELTVIWDDAETGVRCKARIDWFNANSGVVLDLKSTQDARASEFEREIFKRGYFRQLPMYQDALAANGVNARHTVFAALEKTRPYAVAGYRLADDAANAGREELRALLQTYAACQASGVWPAYPTDIAEVTLPLYAWEKLEVAA